MAKRKSSKQIENTSVVPETKVDAEGIEAATPSPGDEQAHLLDLAAPLMAAVQIRDIRLTDSRVVSHHTPGEPAVKGYLKIRIHDTTYAIVNSETNKGLFWVKVPFSLVVAKQLEQTIDHDLIFEIDASFRIIYQTKRTEHLTDTILDAFAKTNAVFNAWSYWREFAQNTTSRMGFPPVTVPVYRM